MFFMFLIVTNKLNKIPHKKYILDFNMFKKSEKITCIIKNITLYQFTLYRLENNIKNHFLLKSSI